ncbi:MAG TPA: zinc ribbon domain-containing protein [Dehalococcoidia bacterium]|nr:zinc ribbon domain-containing protein [Dehalococcoidia bacterium]
MPIYEYYCEHCDGIFEALRPMREASDPVPCPVCDRDGQRIMPTEFTAFTMRDGYPRRIPDKGTYWHLGKEVKQPIRGPVRPNEHPELNPPRPKPKPTKAELEEQREREELMKKEATHGLVTRRRLN